MKKALCDIQEISNKNSRLTEYAEKLATSIEEKIRVIRGLSLIKRCIDNLDKKGFKKEVIQQISQIVSDEVTTLDSPNTSLNQTDNTGMKNSLSGAKSSGQDSSTEKSHSRNELWNSRGSILLEDEYDLHKDKVRCFSLVLAHKKPFDRTKDEEYIAELFCNLSRPARRTRSGLAVLCKGEGESVQSEGRKALNYTLDYSECTYCLKSRKKHRNNSTINVTKPMEDLALEKNVSIGDFEVVKGISSGAYGKVCLVKKRSSGDYFAMKIIDKIAAIEKAQECMIRREVRIMRSIDCDYIVKLYYSFQNNKYLFFVMEYLSGGDLRNLLSLCGQLDEKVRFVKTC